MSSKFLRTSASYYRAAVHLVNGALLGQSCFWRHFVSSLSTLDDIFIQRFVMPVHRKKVKGEKDKPWNPKCMSRVQADLVFPCCQHLMFTKRILLGFPSSDGWNQLSWENVKLHFKPPVWKSTSGSYDQPEVPKAKDLKVAADAPLLKIPSSNTRFKVVGGIPKRYIRPLAFAAANMPEMHFIRDLVSQLPGQVLFHFKNGHQWHKVKVGSWELIVSILETRIDRLLVLMIKEKETERGNEKRVLFYCLPDSLDLFIVGVFVHRAHYLNMFWSFQVKVEMEMRNQLQPPNREWFVPRKFLSGGEKNRLI